ncbi:hypothetical protein LCGC14_1168120 [marine sediment metagenome]|uniref:Uncharacterized protein n=1 Tax=marine sediment metagenome TaxID=412755 RepID=A0A0F9LQT7_9ZZZZ
MLKTDVKKKVETYTLKLTADELSWLLLEVFPAAIRNAEGSFATEMRDTRDAWWDEVAKQGWRPF